LVWLHDRIGLREGEREGEQVTESTTMPVA
jgi:hypothetical protein